MKKEKEKTKRKVNLVSSHSDNESNDGYGPLLVSDNNGPALSEIYKDRFGDDLESRLRYKPRPGETVIEEAIYIPDVDHG